jgi:3',5'-cyclic AMP phosphodiesterase CpdA
MFTGDMINRPKKSSLMKFLPYANKLNVPWYASFGNHDIAVGGELTKELYLTILNSHNRFFSFEKPYYSFKPKKGYKVIVLDSVIDYRITSNGNVSEEQLLWLNKELKKSQKDVVLIFLHGPLIEPLKSSGHRTLNADEILAVINKYKNPTKITQMGNVLHVSTPALVSYPNAFRIVRINNQKKKAIFDFYFKETRLEDVQKKAKLMVFGSQTYYGADDDRTATYTIEK